MGGGGGGTNGEGTKKGGNTGCMGCCMRQGKENRMKMVLQKWVHTGETHIIPGDQHKLDVEFDGKHLRRFPDAEM